MHITTCDRLSAHATSVCLHTLETDTPCKLTSERLCNTCRKVLLRPFCCLRAVPCINSATFYQTRHPLQNSRATLTDTHAHKLKVRLCGREVLSHTRSTAGLLVRSYLDFAVPTYTYTALYMSSYASGCFPEAKRPKHNWRREDIVRCFCPDKKYGHVHCPCEKCNNAAVSTATEMSRWQNRWTMAWTIARRGEKAVHMHKLLAIVHYILKCAVIAWCARGVYIYACWIRDVVNASDVQTRTRSNESTDNDCAEPLDVVDADGVMYGHPGDCSLDNCVTTCWRVSCCFVQ